CGEEVASAVELGTGGAGKPQPGFMHQSGRLERLPGGLLSHFRRRQLAQFLIDQRQQFRGSFGITLLCAVENASDVAHVRRIAKEQGKLPDFRGERRGGCMTRIFTQCLFLGFWHKKFLVLVNPAIVLLLLAFYAFFSFEESSTAK